MSVLYASVRHMPILCRATPLCMASDAENQLDRTENQHRDSGEDWYTRRKRHLMSKLSIGNSKYCHWKRRSDSVFLATIEGEIEAKCFHGRRRTAWIDDVRRWTGDNMNVARTKCNGKKIRLLVAGCLRVVRHTNNNNTIIACPYQILWQNLGGVKKCDFRPISRFRPISIIALSWKWYKIGPPIVTMERRQELMYAIYRMVPFPMTFFPSDLEWLSEMFIDTQCARPLCDSWASCLFVS